MPQIDVFDRTGATVGSVELSDELFAAPVNAAVLHQVVTAQLAGRRTGTHDTRTRGERYRCRWSVRWTVKSPAMPIEPVWVVDSLCVSVSRKVTVLRPRSVKELPLETLSVVSSR